MDTRRDRGFYGWKLVGALWFLDMLNMGFPLYCAAVIHTYMLKQIPMERATFGLGYTLVNFFIGVPSTLIGAVIIRRGIRFTLVIGAALILAGSLWLALVARAPWHYLVGFGVLIGSGIGFGTVMPIATAITRWFVRFRGRALAITLTAWGVAGFVGAPQFNRLLESNGGNFRQAWLIIAGLSVAAAAISWLFIVERPEDLGQRPDGNVDDGFPVSQIGRPVREETAEWPASEAYRTRAYWLIYVGSIACQFPSFFFTAHGILHLRLAGISAAAAAWAMGLYTLGGLGGRIIGGVLVDKISERFAFMIGLSFYVIGTVLALRVDAEHLWVANAAAMLYGAGMGSAFICLNTITGNYYGQTAFPRLNGTMMMLSGLVCCLAGVIGGKLFDMSGNYTAAFLLNLGLSLAGIVALVFATRPVRAAEGVAAA
ncbi:MAG TPA: MFS transporter [Candidatus Nitrosotalea sp.]|nr:MFS transporter [Candidatus Nitrosotalea sp.]